MNAVDNLQKLSCLSDINLETHSISANLGTTKKYSKSLRTFINVITFGIYGYYLKSQMLRVAKKIRDVIADKQNLLSDGVWKTEISNVTMLSINIEGKLKHSRHSKAHQILSKALYPGKTEEIDLKPVTKDERERVLKACYDFALKIREDLAKENPNKNINFSTPSILLAVSMTLKGFNQEDKQTFIEAVGLQGMDEERIHVAVGSLTDTLTVNTRNAKCTVSNAVMTRTGFTPEFIKTIKQQYKGEVFFGKNGKEVADKANAYVKKNTKGVIKKVVEPSPDLLSVILNAVYFKGEWMKAFNKEDTKFVEFTGYDGTKNDVFMLHSMEDIPYYEADNFKMIEKEYKSSGGEKLSFLAFIPRKDNDIEILEKTLTMQMVQNCRKHATNQEVKLRLPKFDIETTYPNLKKTLENIGISFNGGVEGQPIDQVIHKTRIKLDEWGTEAGAATSVNTKECASMPKKFNANRPFSYLILINDQVLFQGSIRNPKGL